MTGDGKKRYPSRSCGWQLVLVVVRYTTANQGQRFCIKGHTTINTIIVCTARAYLFTWFFFAGGLDKHNSPRPRTSVLHSALSRPTGHVTSQACECRHSRQGTRSHMIRSLRNGLYLSVLRNISPDRYVLAIRCRWKSDIVICIMCDM